ncbi:hypothetical protein CLOHAE12215_01356 [Clostridium haemolyticum]|uniref:Rha family transcriptional regulator n=1 Tax=Clostridium haemolyticum TaxID=84025 RepID=UPI001C3AC6AA|nr:Rha family transcriptional regulator [Clostridium haemolyticum]CAG7839940.1 hypothetical protein CLOHAE12215_01356 [Clostridium haemolyticum]
MNKLTVLNNNRELTIDSREVAKMLGIEHKLILRKLEGSKSAGMIGIIPILGDGISVKDYFIKSSYKDAQNKERKCYNITLKGIGLIIDASRKTKKMKPLIEWYNNNSTQERQVILTNRFEDEFMNKLEQALEPMELILEKQFIVDSYRLDGYIPSLRLAIEYDEGQHKISTNQKLDEIRQNYISGKLGCMFIRCDYEDTDAYNIGKVFKKIMEVR